MFLAHVISVTTFDGSSCAQRRAVSERAARRRTSDMAHLPRDGADAEPAPLAIGQALCRRVSTPASTRVRKPGGSPYEWCICTEMSASRRAKVNACPGNMHIAKRPRNAPAACTNVLAEANSSYGMSPDGTGTVSVTWVRTRWPPGRDALSPPVTGRDTCPCSVAADEAPSASSGSWARTG
jgi:hypothetical protein